MPGAHEMPLAVEKVAASRRFDGIVALGAVIRGATPHFDYVSGECMRGVAAVARAHGIPVGMGVLTTDSIEQALAANGVMTMASGELPNEFKFFLYAQDSDSNLYLIQSNVEKSAEPLMIVTVKAGRIGLAPNIFKVGGSRAYRANTFVPGVIFLPGPVAAVFQLQGLIYNPKGAQEA